MVGIAKHQMKIGSDWFQDSRRVILKRSGKVFLPMAVRIYYRLVAGYDPDLGQGGHSFSKVRLPSAVPSYRVFPPPLTPPPGAGNFLKWRFSSASARSKTPGISALLPPLGKGVGGWVFRLNRLKTGLKRYSLTLEKLCQGGQGYPFDEGCPLLG